MPREREPENNDDLLNTIFLGEVASVQNYGAFVKIPGARSQGLIHRTQISNAPVDDASDVLQRGERVWCKAISVEDNKVALSMKVVDQGSGRDLDPNGVQIQQDEQRRKQYDPRGRKKAIELGAVLNTTCAKCGTHGHLKKDCFKSADGKTYELLLEDSEEVVHEAALEVVQPTPEKSSRPKKEKKRKKKKHKKESKKEKKSKKSKKRRRESTSSDSSSSHSDEMRRPKKSRHSK